MTKVQQETSVSQHVPDYLTTPISIKLDGTNYALWSQVVEMYIAGRDKLGYLNGELTLPASTDPSFQKWRIENAIVKGWLINSLDIS